MEVPVEPLPSVAPPLLVRSETQKRMQAEAWYEIVPPAPTSEEDMLALDVHCLMVGVRPFQPACNDPAVALSFNEQSARTLSRSTFDQQSNLAKDEDASDDEHKRTVLLTNQDMAASEMERHFLNEFCIELVVLSACNFITMPIIWVIAFFNTPFQFALFFFAKVAFAHLAQLRQVSRLERWVQDKTGEQWQVYKDALVRLHEPYCAQLPCIPAWMILTACRMFEAVDPDFDAWTAGSAWHTLSKDLNDKFKLVWCPLPIFGYIVKLIGLPGVLTCLVSFATIAQVYQIYDRYLNAIIKIQKWGEKDQRTPWNAFSHIADVGGLMLSWQFLQEFVRSVEKIPHNMPVQRDDSFLVKVVLEALANSWFTISYLDLLWADSRTNFQTLAVVFASLCFSLFTILIQLTAAIRVIADGFRGFPSYQKVVVLGTTNRRWFYRLIICAIVTLIVLGVVCIRVVLILNCPSHMLNLQFECIQSVKTID